MNAQKYFRSICIGLLIAAANVGTTSAWDFDRTRAADIMDRAANDGNATAQLLLALALDDRVQTVFDNYQFRLPVVTDESRLHVRRLHHEHLYENLMDNYRDSRKESMMAYSLKGTFALSKKKYWMAVNYYGAAINVGERLLNGGMHPEIDAVIQDARAGRIAAAVCKGSKPSPGSAGGIARLLRSHKESKLSADYLAYIKRNSDGAPGYFTMKGTGCWQSPHQSATVILPTAPYNYEINTRKYSGVMR